MTYKSVLRLGVAAMAVACCLQAASADVDDMWNNLDKFLFRAGEQADVGMAKYIVDYAREHHLVDDIHQKEVKAVDICFAAGAKTPQISKGERQAILSDPRIAQSFTPNTNMKLAEGFANGWGVKADLKRATAFACRANTVPAELMGQIDSLQKPAFTKKQPFTFCNYVTSGLNSGYCAGFDADAAGRIRDQKIAAVTAGYSAAQKAAFEKLRKAAFAYFAAHASHEQDMTGTARDVFYVDALSAKQDLFLRNLRNFEAGVLPPPPVVDGATPKAADHELNITYQKIMKLRTDPDAMTGSVTREGVRKTERAWIRYRDAWLAFAKLRRPDVNMDNLEIWLCRQRVTELRTKVKQELPQGL